MVRCVEIETQLPNLIKMDVVGNQNGVFLTLW
jgi:hypothetical protein